MAKAGMVIGSRGARACDVCGKERARWYCAADEAYLCEKCDASVHSANAVAGRHERVRLGPNGAPMKINRRSTSSGKPKPPNKRIIDPPHPPSSWHPRRRTQITYPRIITTIHSPLLPHLDHHDPPLLLSVVKSEPTSPPPPSPGRTSGTGIPPVAKVEIDCADLSHEVPIIEPFLEELISVTSDNLMEQILPSTPSFTNDSSIPCFVDHFLMQSVPGEIDHGDMDEPIEDGSNSIGDVSAIDEFDLMDLCNSSNPEKDAAEFDIPTMDMWSPAEELWLFGPNPFKAKGEIQFEVKEEADADGTVPAPAPSIELCTDNMEGAEKKKKAFRRTLSLRLNYEDVLTAWSDRGSLWMGGERPQTVPDDSIFESDFEAGLVPEMDHQAGEVPAMERSNTEAAREARVMRYREKRRTRLFSKKIRYEVRKLNAERRPRMKGRFIKRSLPNVGVQLEHL